MKAFAVAVLSVFVAAGLLTTPVLAQQTPPGQTMPERPAPATPQEKPPAPSDAAKPDVKIEGKFESKTESKQEGARDDGAAALPRTAVERTTVFGLSPTAAVILAAALLVVVILAIIAMTRGSDTYIDTNRRI